MSAIQFPVAANAEEALARPVGRAGREREARALAGGPVSFVTEAVGPAFSSREAALDACAGRLDDERPSRAALVAAEDRYLALAEAIAPAAAPPPAEPAFAGGRRWPASPEPSATVFKVMISYWRPAVEAAAPSEGQARALRRRLEASQLTAAELQALTQRPLRPVKPQQPLDVGLFEAPAPEAPHILIPDE